MSIFKRRIPPLCLAAAFALLAACSGGTNAEQQMSGGAAKVAATRILGSLPGLGAASPTPDARQVLTPALLNGSSTPVLLIVLMQVDTGLTMIPSAANLGAEQWRDRGSGAILRRDGILVGTRGLGHDLLSADVSALARALRNGGGEDVLRINRVLNGENQVVATQYLCRVAATGRETLEFYGVRHATTIYAEECTGDGPAFANRYWVDSSGIVRRSQERISEELGVLDIQLLRP